MALVTFVLNTHWGLNPPNKKPKSQIWFVPKSPPNKNPSLDLPIKGICDILMISIDFALDFQGFQGRVPDQGISGESVSPGSHQSIQHLNFQWVSIDFHVISKYFDVKCRTSGFRASLSKTWPAKKSAGVTFDPKWSIDRGPGCLFMFYCNRLPAKLKR